MKRFESEEAVLSQDGVPASQLPRLGRVFTDGRDGRVEGLIERAIRGDAAAFEALVEPHLAHCTGWRPPWWGRTKPAT